MNSFFRRVGSVALTLTLCCAASAEQDKTRAADPSVRLEKSQARVFSDALQAVTSQAHVTVVAEGTPLHSRLSDTDTPDLSASTPLLDAVQRIAAAYDYDVQRDGSVFLFQKRYTDPHDLPGVTVEECLQALQDIARITEAFRSPVRIATSAPVSREPLVQAFMATLSAEQIGAMKRKTLTFASLSSEQQALVRRTAIFLYIQRPTREAGTTLARLKATTNAVFRQQENLGQRMFGYEYQPVPKSPPKFVPLGATLSQPPRDGDDNPSATGRTLDAVVSALNTRSGGTRFGVDAALKEKPVTLVGENNAPPDAVLQAMATVYGLRVKTQNDGGQSLTRPIVHMPQNVADLPEAARRAFPEPYLRALHLQASQGPAGQARSDMAESYQDYALPDSSEKRACAEARWKRQDERVKRAEQIRAIPSALRDEARRQLCLRVPPKVAAAPDRRLPLSALKESERRAFANFIMAGGLEGLKDLLVNAVPDYISHLGNAVLSGGQGVAENGKPYVALDICLPTPDGKQVLQQAGVTYFLPDKR